jgi:hypothetical protein
MPNNDTVLRRTYLRALIAVMRRRGTGIPVEPPAESYLVVAVLGQSNAQGAGLPLDRDHLDAPHPNVHQFACSGRSKGSIVSGCDPLFHYVPSKAVGFAPSFARLLADATGRAVLLVPTALGDTSITPKNGMTWDPADFAARLNLYREAVASIYAALNTRPGNRLVAILWHQGESDVPLTTAAVYATKLDALIDDLRSHYGDVPFLIGQLVPEEIETGDPNYAAIDRVHADTPNRRACVAYVPGPRASYNSEGEKIHYNAAGQRGMGRRMWCAYQALLDDRPAQAGFASYP